MANPTAKIRNVQKVAIIGGGPSGVVAAKYLLAENSFSEINIFEQRSTAGGVWNYTSDNDPETSFSVPQTTPATTLEKPLWRYLNTTQIPSDSDSERYAIFLSPLYDRLEANLPKMLMRHSDKAFAEHDQLFPSHETITEYLKWYADDVCSLIEFETQVVKVEPGCFKGSQCWSVTTRSLSSIEEKTREYDAVIVASGHYTVPFIPDITGIGEWNKQYPGCISHSKFFRRPEDFKHKKVLIVGNGPSGMDIGAQIAQFSAKPLLISTRSPFTPSNPNQQALPEIAEFLPPSSCTSSSASNSRPRSIRFTNNHVEHSIDAILFCTGYLYSYVFLPTDISPPLITDGARVHNVYQHIFYTGDPTLVFLTLPWNIVPFAVAEAQIAVIARVWSGRMTLPALTVMERWEEEGKRERGKGKAFHRLVTPTDVDYINELYRWSMSADGEGEDGVGKRPPYWGDRERSIRINVPVIKRAFVAKGSHRHSVRRLEELGFCFEGDS